MRGTVTADSSFQELASEKEGVCLKPTQEIGKSYFLLWISPEFPCNYGIAFIVAGSPRAKQDYNYLFCRRTELANMKVSQKPEKEPVDLERITIITGTINYDSKVGDFFPSPETMYYSGENCSSVLNGFLTFVLRALCVYFCYRAHCSNNTASEGHVFRSPGND